MVEYIRATMADHNYFANLIWQIADLLRGPYRPPQYERVMLPMTVLRRFDCVLTPSKSKVLAEHARLKGGKIEGEALDQRLNRAAGQRFHNHSPLDYESAEMGEEVDPARMYAIKGELDASGIYLDEETERFCAVYFKPKPRQSAMDHQAMNSALDPAVSRFTVRQKDNEEEAELWRGKVQAFRNVYGFLSQIIPYQDSDLERLYVFLRHLSAKLPRRTTGTAYQFDDEVRLEYYRLQKISEGSISLQEGDARLLDGPTEVGSGLAHQQPVPLSQLIDVVNERFGTDFNQADQIFFDQIVAAAMADDGLRQAATVNPGDKFELVFKNLLERLFVERMDQNEDIFVRFMNDESFQKIVTSWMAAEAYRRLRSDASGTTPGA